MLYNFLVWLLGMPIVELLLGILTVAGIIMPPLLLVALAIVVLFALIYFLLYLFSPAFVAVYLAIILTLHTVFNFF